MLQLLRISWWERRKEGALELSVGDIVSQTMSNQYLQIKGLSFKQRVFTLSQARLLPLNTDLACCLYGSLLFPILEKPMFSHEQEFPLSLPLRESKFQVLSFH